MKDLHNKIASWFAGSVAMLVVVAVASEVLSIEVLTASWWAGFCASISYDLGKDAVAYFLESEGRGDQQ